MRISYYDRCCKARILCEFGSGHLNEADELRESKAPRSTKEQVLKYMTEALPQLQREGVQVVFACPTNHQPEAIEALTEFGFYGAPEEDLKKNARVCKVYKVDRYGEWDYKSEVQEVDHIMVPLFYLVPPAKNEKKIDYT